MACKQESGSPFSWARTKDKSGKENVDILHDDHVGYPVAESAKYDLSSMPTYIMTACFFIPSIAFSIPAPSRGLAGEASPFDSGAGLIYSPVESEAARDPERAL